MCYQFFTLVSNKRKIMPKKEMGIKKCVNNYSGYTA
jgi:hypothetical protein